MNYLSVENLAKSFGDRILFRDVVFGIDKGQKVAIVAKNGAGKTTLLRCLLEEEHYDSGRIVFRNDIRIAFMGQSEKLRTFNTIFEEVFSHNLPNLCRKQVYSCHPNLIFTAFILSVLSLPTYFSNTFGILK